MPAAQVGWSSELGSCLFLHDSTGQPRIVLSVDSEEAPHIRVRDHAGNVVKDLVG